MHDNKIQRCFGNKPGQELYAQYHDHEWGIPVDDDQRLFEMLMLEGVQAGISWETVLKKRENYRQVFHQFDVHKVAAMSDDDLNALKKDPSIIRNHLKIFAARRNAKVFINIQQHFGSFSHYLWSYVKHKPILNQRATLQDIPTTSPTSMLISKHLKRAGMQFVGPTIIYAYMQAVGLVNDHVKGCWRYTQREHLLEKENL